MKNPIIISLVLFTIGYAFINGFNNAVPQVFLFSLVVIYIILPAYLKFRWMISKHLQLRKNEPTAWA
jgi:hypothetical protein